nr:hypothetical protein [Tanacetum cinerariifolium]
MAVFSKTGKAEEAQVAGNDQVKGRQAEIYQIDMDHASKILSMQEDKPEVHEVVDVVTTAKLITEVVTAAIRVAAAATRRRKRVVIRDLEKESTAIIPADTKSKDKGKLHEELNKDIDWNVAIDHVKQKAKEDPLDYFKGMSYDDIRPIFEAKFNSNIEFILKSKEQLEEVENIAIESINETPAQKAAKRRKLNEEVENLKQHLEIVPDEDNDWEQPLLAVGTTFTGSGNLYCQWELSPGSGNALCILFPTFSSFKNMDKFKKKAPCLVKDLKNDEIRKAPIWVKLHHVPIVAYSEVGLSLITTQIGRPIMLDSYTSNMCLSSWGRNTYARAMIEVSADEELKKSLVVSIPVRNGKGHTLATVDIEYEWTLPRCSTCLIFGHVDDNCPKRPKVDAPTKDTDEGFVEVKRKKSRVKIKNRQIVGIKLYKHALNLQYRRVEKGETSKANAQGDTTKKTDNAQNHSMTGMSTNGVDSVLNDSDSDSEEIEELILKGLDINTKTVTGATTPADTGLCSMVFRHWDWTSNGSSCSKGTRIILGWNHNEVDVAVINLNDQYIHTRVWLKGNRRSFFVLLFTHITDSTSSSSSFNISMREFKECVEEIEVRDVQRSGLQFSWSQKPKRKDGLLKKIDRIMTNVDFNDVFVGVHAIFKPYRVLDHSPSVFNIPTTTVDNEKVVDALVSHYEQFLRLPGITSPFDTTNLFSMRLTDDHARDMIRVISRQEVKDALFSMGNDKSPGQDGYTAAFFKESWEIIVDDFFAVICSPSRVTDYRLISCYNVLFKCISKIIANRIKESLKLLVSPNQSAFVLGKSITDNILLTQELMHNYHLDRGPSRCAFKVDIQKAYDTVDWGFLKEVLVGFGFHARMIGWIMECVTTTSFSISINGSLHGFFKDGCVNLWYLNIIDVCGELELINLCFANDLFLFAHGDVESAIMIKDALEKFKNVSGLTSSLPKSTTYFCNVLNHTKLSILNVLPFEEGQLLVKYLGVPLVSSRLILIDCKELIERVQYRVQDWIYKSLSTAGRLRLIKSVIGELCKGRAKVAWEVVCLPKDEGGLGIFRLDIFNKALMVTHIWKLLSMKESLWVKWIHAYKLRGDGATAFVWFDKWSEGDPLVNTDSSWDIFRTGLDFSTKVRDVILHGSWNWPSYLCAKYSNLSMFVVPNIMENTPDRLVWQNVQGIDKPFSVTQNSIVLDDSNKMIRFKKKLQILKKEIRAWIAIYNPNQKGHIEEIKSKLKNIDQMVDQY